VFVRHDSFALPGIFVMGSTVENLLAGKALATAQEVIKSLGTSPVTSAELEEARSEAMVRLNKELAKPDGIAQAWLDMDTYGLPPIAEQIRALSLVSQSDLQRASTRLFRDAGLASVVAGNSELVKTQIERYIKVELMGELEPRTKSRSESKSDPNATKPQTKPAAKPE
jgi:predicted Zn-dependent peptidase